MMRKVLVTGENGYIGQNFKEWIQLNNKEIELDYISVRSDAWRDVDFTKYDSILHLAGIAHVSRNPKLKEMYYKINRDLTNELAQKAKKDGVKQFIFMSSIIIYGENSKGFINGMIDLNTIPVPNDFYGNSKLQAEKLLKEIEDKDFKISIVRTPMVYGQKSKGNFKLLVKITKYIPFFPSIQNKRSMIYVENLCSFINIIIINQEKGIFFPQNSEYVSTSELVKEISININKKIFFTNYMNKIVNILQKRISILNKVFGNLFYEKAISRYKENYEIMDFKDSISKSVKNEEL